MKVICPNAMRFYGTPITRTYTKGDVSENDPCDYQRSIQEQGKDGQ